MTKSTVPPFVTALLLGLPAFVGAQTNEPAPTSAGLQHLANEIAQYNVFMGPDREQKLDLLHAPVLRYSDPVSSISDGAIFLWLQDGRPEAVMGAHPGTMNRTWIEYQSLSTQPLVATRDGRDVWFPKDPGVRFLPANGDDSAETSPAKRLIQMRSLAASFSASTTDHRGDRQELRLLPQPIHRYSSSTQNVLDGGLFVFVRATNPELLLMIELQQANGIARWHYSPARFTGRACELNHRGAPIWSHDILARPKNPAATYFQRY